MALGVKAYSLEERAFKIIQSLEPQTILVVGAIPDVVSDSDLATRVSSIHIRSKKDIDRLVSSDVTLITQTLAASNRDLMRLLIAKLRDRIAKRFLLLVNTVENAEASQKTGWKQSDLIALGLSKVAQTQSDLCNTVLFHYNIKNYKQTPDWLNAKYWAHPEQFNNDIPDEMQLALQDHEQTPESLITLGDHLKAKRLTNGHSIEKTAAELKIAPVTLWRWEANHYEPQRENLPAIVLYLGYRPEV